MLYTLNLHDIMCQFYLNKLEKIVSRVGIKIDGFKILITTFGI